MSIIAYILILLGLIIANVTLGLPLGIFLVVAGAGILTRNALRNAR